MVFDESSNDEELMLAYQNGETFAFDLLFKRHSARVYGFLMNKLKNRSLADDVFQATFLKLHQSRKHYDPGFPFTPWLFTICKNVLVDYQRKQKRSLEESNESMIETVAANEPASFTFAIEGLSARERQAIEMRYEEELPFEEIARRLQTSPSNVRQIVSRGIKNLKRFMTKEGNSK